MTSAAAAAPKIASELEQVATNADLSPEAAALAEKRANILKALADADKAAHETANIRRLASADTRRFYVSIFAPLATALIAACAFFFQIYQFNQTTLQKLHADQETEWRTAINNFTQPGPQQTLRSAFLLKTFLNSGPHQDEARLFGIRVMRELVFPDGIEMVFPDIMRHTDWTNLNEVIEWDRRQQEIYLKESSKPERPTTPASRATRDTLTAEFDQMQSGRYKDEGILTAVRSQVALISRGISNFLQHNPRPNNFSLDLNNTGFLDAQFTGTDLHGANLTGALVMNCDLRDADLSRITDFGGSIWFNSNWWRAKAISPELLDYLKKEYPFSASLVYPSNTETQSDYDLALQRLQAK